MPILLLISLAISTGSALAQTLPLTDDTWINARKVNEVFGAKNLIRVHTYGPQHGLVRFDTTQVADQAIRQADLRFFLRNIRMCGEIDFHIVTSPWNEREVTFANAPRFQSRPAA